MTKRFLMTVYSALLAASMGLAQDAPAPKPADNGPSLEVTMKFIQDKLNEQGKLVYVVRASHQPAITFNTEMTNVIADPTACSLTYHITGVARAYGLGLRDVRDLRLMTEEEYMNTRSTTRLTVMPPIWVIVALTPANSRDINQDRLFFRDPEMADRVAKALVHAVELCGGGSQPEPF